MNADEHADDGSQDDLSLTAFERLVSYEEAKANGDHAAKRLASDDADSDDLACVDLLHRVWPDLSPAADSKESSTPKLLGDFRLLHELGRGGMGTVFEAEQISMGRHVALKVLPFAALVHENSLQRFRNEVRAAATLNHPNIVPVYSIGEERGVHFYAMQLIRGRTLADMIEELRKTGRMTAGSEAPTIDSSVATPAGTKRDTQGRISTAVDSRRSAETYRVAARLGIQAAEALQHAHDQGVLHRDIKPSNLMLDREGKLYITDFGLARIEADVGLTMTGDILGTLRYMAPEQALAKRVVIDHRADIYSLGATLYELLTLQPAFSETDRSELLKQIAFAEPRPLRKLDRHIPAELETIVLKAIAKNPDERYQTAQQVEAELNRFLTGEPIQARPINSATRVIRWMQRNKSVSILSSAVALALLIGVVVSTYFAIHANRQAELAIAREKQAVESKKQADESRRNAESRQKEAEAVTQFLVKAFKSPDPNRDGRTVTVAEILDQAEKDLESLTDQPLTQAALLQAIGDVRPGLGLYLESLEPLRRAKVLRERELGAEHPDTLQSLESLAAAIHRLNRRSEAQGIYETVLAARRKIMGSQDPLTLDTMGSLSYVYRLNGRDKQAVELANEVYLQRRKTLGEGHGLTVHAASRLGAAYRQMGRFDEAIELQEAVLARRRQENKSGASLDAGDLVATYHAAGRYQQAIELSLETIAAKEKTLGRNHPETHNSINILAACYLKTGRAADAIPLSEEIVEGSRQRFGDNEIGTLNYRLNLGKAYSGVGRVDDAIRVYEETLAGANAAFGPASRYTFDVTMTLIKLYSGDERVDQALARYEELLADARKTNGDEHPGVRTIVAALVELYEAADCPKDANELQAKIVKVNRRNVEELNAKAWRLATSVHDKVRDGKGAVEYATQACDMTEYNDPVMVDTLAAAYAENGDFKTAVKWSEKALELAKDDSMRKTLASHLDSFRNGRPWRE